MSDRPESETDMDEEAQSGDERDAPTGEDGAAAPESQPGDDLAAAPDADHALDPDDLQYPEFAFEDGSVDDRGGFDLERDLSREELGEWLADLAGGLKSHDVAVAAPDGHVTFGVGPKSVSMAFDPDDSYRGELTVTLRLNAKAMKITGPDGPDVGARGGKGFIPIEALTTDREQFRCYNWIDEPDQREASDGVDGGDGEGGGDGGDGGEDGGEGDAAADDAS